MRVAQGEERMVSNHDQKEDVQKPPYQTPKLEVYGPIAKLTQSSGRGSSDNGGRGGHT